MRRGGFRTRCGAGTAAAAATFRDGRARRGGALIAAWARDEGLGAVALGHTLDDQAETFVMRMARGSGVDGLSAMAPVTGFDGLLWLRPLLGVRRAAVRAWLVAEGVGWAEDPGNDDWRFERVRARAALPLLAPLGLGVERLAATAAAMARARAALEQATAGLAREGLTVGAAGDVVIARAALAEAPAELALRLLAGGAVLGGGGALPAAAGDAGGRAGGGDGRGIGARADAARLRGAAARGRRGGAPRAGAGGRAGARSAAGTLGRALAAGGGA